MRNYLAAECYKVFHRKYFYLTLLAVLVLEGLLLGAYWLTLNWGNPTVDFAFAANTLATCWPWGCTPRCSPSTWCSPSSTRTAP